MLSRFWVIPLLAALVAQLAKFAIKSNRTKLTWRNLFAYSGMPSSHAATVISLTATIGMEIGFASPTFGLAAIFAFITIRDAAGLRRQLGRQGKVINELTQDLDEDKLLDEQYPKLLEKIGHTPTQLLVGSLIGLIVALLGHAFLPSLMIAP